MQNFDFWEDLGDSFSKYTGNIGGNIHFRLKRPPTLKILRFLISASKVMWKTTDSFQVVPMVKNVGSERWPALLICYITDLCTK